jgi:hypothetical protein
MSCSIYVSHWWQIEAQALFTVVLSSLFLRNMRPAGRSSVWWWASWASPSSVSAAPP